MKLLEEGKALLGEGEVFCQVETSSFSTETQEIKQLRKGLEKSLRMTTERKDALLKSFTSPEARIKHIKGDVLITKNPCGHEGDIRQAKAIGEDHPAYKKLKHLVNVIVFPSVGSRPLQN